MSTAVLEKPVAKWTEYGFSATNAKPNLQPAWVVTVDRMAVALAKLNEFETADDIAKFLESQGVKGVIGDSRNCPLAVWLKRAVVYNDISVGWNTCATFGLPNTVGAVAAFATSEVMRAFYNAFDYGHYPALLK